MKILGMVCLLVLVQCTSKNVVNQKSSKTSADRTAIRNTILSHKKYIGNCYGQALMKKGNEHLKGTVTVNFDIGPDGKAHSAQIVHEKTNLRSEHLNRCLLVGLKSWDFPVHPEGKEVTVRYPFVFKANPPANMQQKLDQFQNFKRAQ